MLCCLTWTSPFSRTRSPPCCPQGERLYWPAAGFVCLGRQWCFPPEPPFIALLCSNSSWDVQVQRDVNEMVNIGWVLSRSSQGVIRLWREVEASYAQSGMDAGGGDDNAYQGQVRHAVGCALPTPRPTAHLLAC